jgi:hypothetical protein
MFLLMPKSYSQKKLTIYFSERLVFLMHEVVTFNFDVFLSFNPSNIVHNHKYVTKIEWYYLKIMLDNFAS